MLSGVEVGHLAEGVSLQGSATNQGTVDVRLSHKLLDVAGLGRAAVEHAHDVGNLVSVVLAQGSADSTANFLSILAGSGLAGADGPDGLVSDDDLGDVLTAPALEGSADLANHKLYVGAGLADL